MSDTTAAVVVDQTVLPILRLHRLRDCVCIACGVFMGDVRLYRGGNVGLASVCGICWANLQHAKL